MSTDVMSEDKKDPFFDIIEGCIKGERKYQQLVYQKLYGKMMGACLRYSANNEEAKDILQDGFLKVFTSIKSYQGKGSFEGWVRKIIVNTALDYIRKNKQFINHTSSDFIEDKADETTDESEYLQLSTKEIMQAVQQLPEAYRTVFNLFVVDGFSHQEIADQLGINIGTSKSNLSKEKAHLKKDLEKIVTAHQK